MDIVPAGHHTVTAWVVSQYETAAVIDFVVAVLDAVELTRIEENGLLVHAEVRIGDSVLMLFDEPRWPASPSFLRVFVADDGEVLRRAVEHGSVLVTEPTELFWGDRASRFRDPFGNVWWLQQRVSQLSEEEIRRRYFDPAYDDAMRYTRRADVFDGAPVESA